MRYFITGASGFIGSAVATELLGAGHKVTGLARSPQSAARLRGRGIDPVEGTIEDVAALRRGASEADGVIHTAFFHGFSQPRLTTRLRIMFGGAPSGIVGRFQNAAVDAEVNAIQAFGSVLRGSARPLVIAFPTMAMRQGAVATEAELADPASVGGARARSEQAALQLAADGIRTSIVRLPPAVHDHTKLGLVSMLTTIARKKGVSAYIGDGGNRWGAVHRLDAAHLFCRALAGGEPGTRYHALAEIMAFKPIAEAIGHSLKLPVRSLTPDEGKRHFSWLAPFVAADNPVSSDLTREKLGWQPDHPALLADLQQNLRSAKR